jgi:multicomponent Na+:H+ antiporter subunit B
MNIEILTSDLLNVATLMLMAATGIAIARLRNLFAVVMLSGIYSLLGASLYVILDAVDVAFTEAAVGAGASTVLMIGTLALTSDREKALPSSQAFKGFLVCLFVGAVLVYGSFDMPLYGDPTAPIHHHVVPRYINDSMGEIGLPNIVTSVLASYRGYDTMGEAFVIFTAAIGVITLIGRARRSATTNNASQPPIHARMEGKLVLRVVSKLLIPFILLFGLYVQWHGDFGPGGGFQAGVIVASGFVVYGLIYGLGNLRSVLPAWVTRLVLALGVMLYAGVGVATMILGGNFLDYDTLAHDPTHGQHYGILLVEAGVGMAVFGAIVTIFCAFAGRAAADVNPASENGGPV